MEKGYCGVRVFVYKNIIQSSNSACIPELHLAAPSLVTQSTSTAYEGNTRQRLHTELHEAQQLNNMRMILSLALNLSGRTKLR